MTNSPSDLRAMLATAKKNPLVRQFMGDSLHPGGVAMTLRLAQFAQATAGKRTLVRGLGQVEGALHLAKTSGTTVVSLLEDPGEIQPAVVAAAKAGVGHLVTFTASPPSPATFDAITAEGVAALVQEPDKVPVWLASMLRLGGTLAMAEVVVSEPSPQEVYDILAAVGWPFHPMSLKDTILALELAGLVVTHQEEQRELLPSVFKDLIGKLGTAEMGARFGVVPIDVAVIQRIKKLTEHALAFAQQGRLGYAIVVAAKK